MQHGQFKEEIKRYISLYPYLRDEILDFYELCMTEIEQGGSPEHERELAISDIEELIKQNEEL